MSIGSVDLLINYLNAVFIIFFLGFREFRIFETHYFYNTCLDPDFFKKEWSEGYLGLPGGGGGPRHIFGNFTV